jgi:predicted acyltransferase
MSIGTSLKPRLASLDQFRGYTIAGMDLVNFLGGFVVSPYLVKHHNTFCSYADTIMPHFMFAVGFSFRLSFGRRALTEGTVSAYLRVLRRLAGLFLVALFVFQLDDRLLPTYWMDLAGRQAWDEIWRPFRKNWTQTLFQIALTTLWVAPAIRLPARWRMAYLAASAALHVVLNHFFYFHWMYAPPVEGHIGGPVGCLAWSIPTLVGTLACDAIVGATGWVRLAWLFVGACTLIALGWVMSCGTRWYDVPPDQIASQENIATAASPVVPDHEALARWQAKIASGDWSSVAAEPPFMRPPDTRLRKLNYWMMSAKMATLSFMIFNAGFSLLVYLIFYVVSDVFGWQLGVFRTLGRNSLAGYLLQWPTVATITALVEWTAARWGPGLGFPADATGRNAPAIFVVTGLVLCLFVNWLLLRLMEKKGIFLKV